MSCVGGYLLVAAADVGPEPAAPVLDPRAVRGVGKCCGNGASLSADCVVGCCPTASLAVDPPTEERLSDGSASWCAPARAAANASAPAAVGAVPSPFAPAPRRAG